jgi:hypothetical protein
VVPGVPTLASTPLVLGSVDLEAAITKDIVLRISSDTQLQIAAANGEFTPFTFAPPSGHIYVNAGRGNDTITVGPISTAATLSIDGGVGNDRVLYEVQAGPTAQDVSFSDSAQRVTINGKDFYYSGVESPKNLVVTATDSADLIVLSPVGADYQIRSANSPITFGAITIDNNLDSLTLKGGLGDDTITVSGVTDFTPALTLDGGDGVDALDLGNGHYASLTLGTGTLDEGNAGNDAVTGNPTIDAFTFNARPSIANRVHVFRPEPGKITINDETDIGDKVVTISDPLQSLTINTGYNAPATDEYIELVALGTLDAYLTLNAGKLSKNLDGPDSVTITSDLTLPGHRLDITANTITINSTVTVSTSKSSGAGAINLHGYHLTLGTGAKLLAQGSDTSTSGDITLAARDENALVTPLVDVDVSDVDVTIAANAVISGRDVFLLASADNRRLF